MAKNIVNREGEKLAKGILDIMGIDLLTDGSVKIREESCKLFSIARSSSKRLGLIDIIVV